MIGAAVYWPPTDKAYFFRHDHYVRYRLSGGEGVEEVVSFAEKRWKGLPYRGGIQAAAAVPPERVVYFFQDDTYVAYSFEDVSLFDHPVKVADYFNLPAGWHGDFDTVMYWPPNGKMYFFKGSEYVRYNLQEGRAEDQPLPIADHWSGLTFTDIDASFVGGRGTAYFFKDVRYIRYIVAATGDRAREAARPTANHWPGLADALASIPTPGGMSPPVSPPVTPPPDTELLPSTFDAEQPGLMRGRIFFRQREAALGEMDDERRKLLREALTKYGPAVATARARRPHVTLPFAFVGYASPEDVQPGPDGLASNQELAEVRAQKVAEYARDVLIAAGVQLDELEFHIFGYGEDPAGQGMPEAMWPLYRRVEILAPPADADGIAIEIPKPWVPRPLEPICASTEWDMRLAGVVTTSLPVPGWPIKPATIGIGIDVKDATGRYNSGNPERLILLGFGASSSSLPKYVRTTGWKRVTTTAPICLGDFQGPARYEILFSPVLTIQTIIFTGPMSMGAVPPVVWWAKSALSGWNRVSADGWVETT